MFLQLVFTDMRTLEKFVIEYSTPVPLDKKCSGNCYAETEEAKTTEHNMKLSKNNLKLCENNMKLSVYRNATEPVVLVETFTEDKEANIHFPFVEIHAKYRKQVKKCDRKGHDMRVDMVKAEIMMKNKSIGTYESFKLTNLTEISSKDNIDCLLHWAENCFNGEAFEDWLLKLENRFGLSEDNNFESYFTHSFHSSTYQMKANQTEFG